MILRKLREEKRLSQEQLALMAGLSTRTIQRIESGYKASQETLKALASVLEVHVSTLEEEIDVTEEIINTAGQKKPTEITYAVIGIYTTLVLASVSAILSKLAGESTETALFFSLLGFAVLCIVPYKINSGSNAARFVFLVMFALDLFLGLGGLFTGFSVYEKIAVYISLPIELAVIYLLFNKHASAWFYRNKPGESLAT